jgi:voltage-gated potassium channel
MTERLRDHYIVCGFGRVGRQVAGDLRAAGALYVVIDADVANREAAYAPGVRFIHARPSDDEALREAGIARARAIVACVDSDAENVFIALTARELRPDIAIVARASREENENKLRRAGADRVVTPDAIGGHRLALALLRPAVHDLFNEIFSFGVRIAVDVGQITIEAHSPFAGQTVAGCDLRRVRNVSILAVREPAGGFTLNPDAERIISVGETLIVIGPAEAVYELEAMYSGD